MTQCEMVINYIKTFGSITTMDAFKDLGITRLASRIYELRDKGYLIEGEPFKCRNRFGKTVSFMKYSLKGE